MDVTPCTLLWRNQKNEVNNKQAIAAAKGAHTVCKNSGALTCKTKASKPTEAALDNTVAATDTPNKSGCCLTW
jgi:hypothetical protein